MKRFGVVIILLAAFCGLADSAYLAQHEINGTPLLCNIQDLSGCNIVASSTYSHLFGIPLSEYGILFYGLLFVLAAFELVIFDKLLRHVLQGAAFLGLICSVYFEVIQIFVINAICVYCLASALLALLIFLFACFIEPMRETLFDPILRASGLKKKKQPTMAAAVQKELQELEKHLTMPPAA